MGKAVVLIGIVAAMVLVAIYFGVIELTRVIVEIAVERIRSRRRFR